MKLLACDIGTSHCKAGLFELDGTACHVALRATPVRRAADGRADLDPEQLWQTMVTVLAEAAAACQGSPIAALGIASMAETGLLVDRHSARPRSPLIPWFDTGARPQAERIAAQEDPLTIFRRSGLRVSYKCGLAKLLWLRQHNPEVADGAVWLSAADFVAQRLTGRQATDPTLAVRTLAYRLDAGCWDADWLARWGLDTALFPPVLPSGQIMGHITRATAAETGLPAGLPVAICGHDHIVAALAVGATAAGIVLDSIGTAEALVGALPARPLTDEDFASGLVFGPHVAPDQMFWMAALSASGGALDWLRGVLDDPPLSYEELAALSAQTTPEPADLLFLPYLLGAQAPWPDPRARGAFIGLTEAHRRADLVKAVLQGIAYEVTCILHAAEAATDHPIQSVVAAGGGVRVPMWLQIRADATGRPMIAAPHPEATLLGAARLAGLSAGVYGEENPTARWSAAHTDLRTSSTGLYQPDPGRHLAHRRLLEVYRTLQAPLRAAAACLGSTSRPRAHDASALHSHTHMAVDAGSPRPTERKDDSL